LKPYGPPWCCPTDSAGCWHISLARAIFLASGVLCLSLLPLEVRAQSPNENRSLQVTPVASASLSFSDNASLAPRNKLSQATTVLAAGVALVSRGDRVRGTLDYSLNLVQRSRGTDTSDLQHSLAAAFVAEPVKNSVFIDATASISQQSISAFGLQTADSSQLNPNRAEVRSIRLSPYVKSNLAGMIDVEARVAYSRTNTSTSSSRESDSLVYSLRASGCIGSLQCSFDLSRNITKFGVGRETTLDKANLSVDYIPHYDWRLKLRAGRENNDVLSLRSESTQTVGIGAQWAPSPRTEATADTERRYFGNAHQYSFTYRTPRTIWRVTDVRDATIGRLGGVDSIIIQAYDRLFPELASQYPDPIERDRVVRSILFSETGFRNTSAVLTRRQGASAAWSGLRATALLTVYRSQTSRLDKTVSANDDLSLVEKIRQFGFTANLGYRLSPTSRFSFDFNRQNSTASGAEVRGTSLQTVGLSWVEQVWSRSAVSISLRRTNFDSSFQPYIENGVTATINLRF
jgi:uncharacterized protein (PEP-CTERM system associated)